jgi:hypothetical protein
MRIIELARTLRPAMPWVPTVLGVGALIALLLVAAAPFSDKPDPQFGPAPQPFLPAEPLIPVQGSPSAGPSAPQTSAATAAPGEGASAPSAERTTPVTATRPTTQPATRPTTARPAPTRTTQAPPATVTGRYRVVDSFGDGFIGEVLVGNGGGQSRDWTVRLRFPAHVGELITSWVESAPQATLTRSGSTYVWSSVAPVTAGGEAMLRFHFRRSGTGDRPSACTVNGTGCTGLG